MSRRPRDRHGLHRPGGPERAATVDLWQPDTFHCAACGEPIPDHAGDVHTLFGRERERCPVYEVTWAEAANSRWSWTIHPQAWPTRYRSTRTAKRIAMVGPNTLEGMTLWNVGDAATCAAQALRAEPERRSSAFRCVLQLLDDYERATRNDGVAAGAALFQEPPAQTGDSGVDAALAALAEHLARRDGWRPPAWALDERRYAEPWWFVSGVRAWHAIALVESPLAFRKRGVFLTASALERV